MLFVGDIAIPDGIKFLFDSDEVNCNNGGVVGNLEGLIVPDAKSGIYDYKVYNSESTIDYLNKLNVKAVSLANNHVTDVSSAFAHTKEKLKDNNIQFFGAGFSEDEANKPAKISEGGVQYVIIGFGWDVVGCKKIVNGELGVNQLSISNFKKIVKQAIEEYSQARVIPYVHWDYELEIYPQPLHRKLAHWAIDNGAYAVIGCHPHCVQGIELYKGKCIAYSLGNFLFPSNYYFNGKLIFPEFTQDELGVDLRNEDILIHRYVFDKISHSLKKTGTVSLSKSTDEYLDFSDEQYERWFRNNRRKKKALPVFNNMNSVDVLFKSWWVATRQKVIYILVHAGIKGKPK